MSDLSTHLSFVPVAGLGGRDLQLVTFRIGTWEFGADVADVKGIYHGLPMIPTPDAPDVIAGEILISGERIPVLNLPHLFGLNPAARSTEWWIIVLSMLGGPVGFIVERVTEVVRFEATALTLPTEDRVPNCGCITAVARHQQRDICLLDFATLVQEHLQ
jgi:purine-binding chemotaxis protein CheW